MRNVTCLDITRLPSFDECKVLRGGVAGKYLEPECRFGEDRNAVSA